MSSVNKNNFSLFLSIFLCPPVHGLDPNFCSFFIYFNDGLQILRVMLMHWVSLSIVLCSVFLALIHLLLPNGVHVIC